MKVRENYNDIYLFMTVAETGSFTQAAGRLDMAQSNISRAVSGLEERLGVQLLVRTTRKIALTQAGEMLYLRAKNAFERIDNSLNMIADWRETPSGAVRITASTYVIDKVLLPKLAGFNERYPDIRIELLSENRFIDIISEHYDAGVRLGRDIADGMVAVKIDDEIQMVTVASADYLAQHGTPKTPQDLTDHLCILYQMQAGGVYQWEFEDKAGHTYRHKPQGKWVFTDDYLGVQAALNGWGIAFVPLRMVEEYVQNKQLVRILNQYTKTLPALYLYYPHRNTSPAFRAVLEWLKTGNGE